MPDLLNTRWMFIRYEQVEIAEDHVEVIAIQGDNAIIVTCYSTPLRSWVVPIASLQVQPSAFVALGHARDFDWIDSGAIVHFKGDLEEHCNRPHGVGTWEIDRPVAHGVLFARRHMFNSASRHVQSPASFVGWSEFPHLYRRASASEVQTYREVQSQFEVRWIPEPEPALAEQVTVDLDASHGADAVNAYFQQTANAADIISAINSPPGESAPEEPRRPRWDRLNDEDDT